VEINDLRYETLLGKGPKKIVHWEHWSNPDDVTYISGINFYLHPRKCIERINQIYPFLYLPVPADDAPIPEPEKQESKGKERWGYTFRDYWQQEEASNRFKSIEEILKFSPLENADFSSWNIPEAYDYSEEEVIYRKFKERYPEEIRKMVNSMVETGKMSGGYMMCIGNHIPYNVPPPAVKLYLDISAEIGYRKK